MREAPKFWGGQSRARSLSQCLTRKEKILLTFKLLGMGPMSNLQPNNQFAANANNIGIKMCNLTTASNLIKSDLRTFICDLLRRSYMYRERRPLRTLRAVFQRTPQCSEQKNHHRNLLATSSRDPSETPKMTNFVRFPRHRYLYLKSSRKLTKHYEITGFWETPDSSIWSH